MSSEGRKNAGLHSMTRLAFSPQRAAGTTGNRFGLLLVWSQLRMTGAVATGSRSSIGAHSKGISNHYAAGRKTEDK